MFVFKHIKDITLILNEMSGLFVIFVCQYFSVAVLQTNLFLNRRRLIRLSDNDTVSDPHTIKCRLPLLQTARLVKVIASHVAIRLKYLLYCNNL